MAQTQRKTPTVTKPRITQLMMRDYAALEANYRLICARYEEEKEKMIVLLKDPLTEQENGQLVAVLKETEQRRPKWKEEYIKVAGKAAAEEVAKECPPSYRREIDIQVKPTIQV